MCKPSRLFETSLSDHHELIFVVMKSSIFRWLPCKKVFRCYKKFDMEQFYIALKSELEKSKRFKIWWIWNGFLQSSEKHAPINVKMVKHNSTFFMTKNLRKAIMHKSKFKNRCKMKTSAIIKPNEISV